MVSLVLTVIIVNVTYHGASVPFVVFFAVLLSISAAIFAFIRFFVKHFVISRHDRN
jgi:hypothetical protein